MGKGEEVGEGRGYFWPYRANNEATGLSSEISDSQGNHLTGGRLVGRYMEIGWHLASKTLCLLNIKLKKGTKNFIYPF